MSLLATTLLFLAPWQGPSVKELLDGQLADFRLLQNEDGGYGHNIVDTAHVLVAFTCGPRAYREDDGPFVRRAVQYLLRAVEGLEADRDQDLKIAFALQSTRASRYSSTIEKLASRWNLKIQDLAEAVFPNTLSQDPSRFIAQLKEPVAFADRALACALTALSWQQVQEQSLETGPIFSEVYENGVDFLLASRGESGLWDLMGLPEPGMSALAAKALLGSNREEVRALAMPVLDYLKTLQHKNGSISSGNLPVYVTSVAIMALKAGNRKEDHATILKAADYLRLTQTDQTEGYSEGDKLYGGIGYGSDLRPDLSNLQYALQALHDTGAQADDPAFQKAILFLQRCQNRKESNPVSFVAADGVEVESSNDGGGIYYPGNSPAGYRDISNGKRQALSYGSMTYALLKCYLFAGLAADDPRVAAALEWIGEHWTLEVNPGFDALRDPMAGYMGLFYYYLTVAEALSVSGIDRLKTSSGKTRDWRAEMLVKLASLQLKNGSWVNERAPRWWEGNPVLCTGYALNALQQLRQ